MGCDFPFKTYRIYISSDWMERRVAKTLILQEVSPSYLSKQSELTNLYNCLDFGEFLWQQKKRHLQKEGQRKKPQVK